MSVSHPKSFGLRRSTVGRGQMLVITLLGLILCRFAGAQQIFSRRAALLGVKRFAVPMNDVPMFACSFFHQPFKLLALVAATHVCHCAVLPFSRQSKKSRDCRRTGSIAPQKPPFRSFVRTWTTDLKDRRIRVNAVSPGSIDTPGLSCSLPQKRVSNA